MQTKVKLTTWVSYWFKISRLKRQCQCFFDNCTVYGLHMLRLMLHCIEIVKTKCMFAASLSFADFTITIIGIDKTLCESMLFAT